MDPEQQLRRAVSWRQNKRPFSATKLGVSLSSFVEKTVSPKQSNYSIVSAAWQEILPEQLVKHTRIKQIDKGCLKIVVDSPAYMYELRLGSDMLLEEIQRRCGKAGINKIVFAAG